MNTPHTDRIPGVRQTKSGSYELTITHKLLPKGRAMRNFADRESARTYKERMLEVLNTGILPAELTRFGARQSPQTNPPVRRQVIAPIPVATTKQGSQSIELKELLQQYLDADSAQISKSDRPTVETLKNEIEGRLDGVKTFWVDAWVRYMKRERRLAPGTIRKKKEALARAIDWWNRQQYQFGNAPPNPLDLLPTGYSGYQDGDSQPGQAHRIDRKRDRRLLPGEYELIESVLQGKHLEGKERPWAREDAPDLLMLFRVLVHTAMRLREAYRLRVRDIRFHLEDIYIAQSKTGPARHPPMTEQLEGWLRAYVGDRKPDEIVFPFWNGDNSEAVLKAVSNSLSRRFGTLFDHCGCEGLTEHDLRHEGTCRLMELREESGRWMFRSEEVQIITGHESAQQFKRYVSLQGSGFAGRMRGRR